MLHEALLDLWHRPGEVFDDFNTDIWISKQQLKDFMHPGDVELLRKISNVVAEFHKIEKMLNAISTNQAAFIPNDSFGNDEPNFKQDIYIRALCSGVDKSLQGYRNQIQELEVLLLSNPQLSLTDIFVTVGSYADLFITINSILRSIVSEQICSTQLFGWIDKYVSCGARLTEEAALCCMLAINTGFYNELATWLVFGETNEHSYFFICDCKSNDAHFLYPWEMDDSLQGSSLQQSQSKKSVEKLRKSYVVRKFVIKPKLVPSVISPRLAETILFIGRIVWILQNNASKMKGLLQTHEAINIWGSKALEYSEQFYELRNRCFEEAQLEKRIAEYKATLTKHLWNVMINHADLLEHLKLIRDYYCLGRGELFQEFIIVVEGRRHEIQKHLLSKYLNHTFSDVAEKIYSGAETSHKKFELMLPYKMDPEQYIENPLDYLEMYFDVEWPLHIVFHPQVFVMLNKLFSFLLRVKKTHIYWYQLWLKQKSWHRSKLDSNLIFLRYTLIYLISNLEYYLQVEVIETEFESLKKNIKNANEYSDVVRLHSIFVANLLSKSFVMCVDNQNDEGGNNLSLYQEPQLDADNKNKVYSIIMCLLELCDSFCIVVSKWEEALGESEMLLLCKFRENLEVILENLFKTLNSMHAKVKSEHLMQLLRRLDYKLWHISADRRQE